MEWLPYFAYFRRDGYGDIVWKDEQILSTDLKKTAVSVMLPTEAVWGYDTVNSAYSEEPEESWKKIYDRVRELYPDSEEKEIIRLIGENAEIIKDGCSTGCSGNIIK